MANGHTNGRPTKLTPAIHEAIVQAVSVGVPYLQAAILAGIGESTAKQWRQRGEGTHERPALGRFVAFVADLEKAEAQDEAQRIARINAAGRGGAVTYEKTITYADGHVVREVKRTAPEWTADAWHLERKYPDRYGRRVQADVTVNIQALVAKIAEEMGLDTSALLAEAQALLTEAGDAPGT